MSTDSTTQQAGEGVVSFWEYFQAFNDCQKLTIPLKKAHEEICNTLQAVVLGEVTDYRYVVVNVMPRMGKTKMLEALHSWMHGFFPEAQIITTSYSAELAERTVKYVQSVMQEKWYETTFPHTRLGDTQKADHYTTTANGSLYCAGTNGTILGFGAGLKRPAGGYIAVDDPSNPKEVLSKDVMEKLKLWFESTLKSRRNSDTFTPIIVVAQRLNEDDLCGYILKEYPNETLHLCYPALVNGESQYPETISTASLLAMRDASSLAAFAFESMYNQNPRSLGGNLIKSGEFAEHEFDDRGEPGRWQNKIIVADTAMKAKQSADDTVLQCWAKQEGNYYLLDVAYGKWDSAMLLRTASVFWRKHHRPGSPCTAFRIEDKASGPGLIQQLRLIGIPAEEVKVFTDKVARVHEVLPLISAGLVKIPRMAPWKKAFLNQCEAFRRDGKQKHDDFVDCMAHALTSLGGKGVTIYEVLRRQHVLQTQQSQPAQPALAKAPVLV